MSNIKYVEDGRIAVVTLNRPESLNALSPQLVEELRVALRKAESQSDIRALIITGEGRAFCAGADLKFVGSKEGGAGMSDAPISFLRELGGLFNAIEASPIPVICAVNGICMAGGLELALCCDLILASQSAVFSDAHATYGLIPGGGATARLPRRISIGRAKRMMFTAERIDSRTAEAWGLADEVVEDVDLMKRALELAHQLSQKSPVGLAYMKDMLNGAADRGLHAALAREIELSEIYFRSEQMREGLAAFAERRKPEFKNRQN